jgi:hypothetical protein
MNTTAIAHLIGGMVLVAVSWPLIKGKIGRNYFYGIRIREAFESDERWRDINAYGGRMILRYGIGIMVLGLVGLVLPQSLWFPYIWASLAVIVGGLVVVLRAIRRYARRSAQP